MQALSGQAAVFGVWLRLQLRHGLARCHLGSGLGLRRLVCIVHSALISMTVLYNMLDLAVFIVAHNFHPVLQMLLVLMPYRQPNLTVENQLLASITY